MTAVSGTFDVLPVAEHFGPTFQGEGRSLGRLAYFLRLGGCNLTCRRCDTPYTWDASRYDLRAELANTPVGDILASIPAGPPLVVITGGEPMLYARRPALVQLVAALVGRGQEIEFETNGTIPPGVGLTQAGPAVRFNVSPKLDGPMSDDPADRRIVPDALAAFVALAEADRAVFKFVVDGPAAVDQAAALVVEHGIDPSTVWIMAEGNDPVMLTTRSQAIADRVLMHGFNLTTRLHVLLWPKTDRGR